MTKNDVSQRTDKVCVLIVDDHPSTAATLARALSQLDGTAEVISATNSKEALEKVKDKAVDILITDMIMPEMTGLELIEKLRDHPGGKPSRTYLVTAYDVPGLKVTAQRLKVNEVLIKPVRPERVYQIISKDIEEMKQSTQPSETANVEKRKFKILVADDRPDNLTLLARYLEYEGYDHVDAQDGEETLIKAQDEMPDLVLLDVDMPKKNGFDVLEEIRANPNLAHIPVIILTAARLDSADVQEGLNLGADDYITKPFDRRELMARIRAKLRVKEAEDVTRRRNRELSLLPEIGKELSARTDLKDIANILLKRTAETLGANQGHMLMLNSDGNITEHFQHSVSESVVVAKDFQFQQSLFNHVLETRQGIIIENALSHEFWHTTESDQTRSVVVAPLFGRRDLLGLLFLTNEQENYFTLDHLLLLQAIASQAAIAIENVRLYQNVTEEQKQLEKIKNEFIATASHDLKNPIMSISGYSTLLKKAGPLTDQQEEFIERIQSSTKNMLELVQNMLQLTEIDLQKTETSREAIDTISLLKEVVGEFEVQAQQKGQTLQLQNEIASASIYADMLQIKQAIRNLIGNAIKYTPSGGQIFVVAKLSNDYLEIQVQDSGYGIPSTDLPYIFDRFYRVRTGNTIEIEGNGLGLAIVKSIVEQHQGVVQVQSNPNQGTAFTINLPLAGKSALLQTHDHQAT
ncbi:MAG: response regulator [Anaerolineales bacterium]|nr:response regulator [Anaerolineales bacterium]